PTDTPEPTETSTPTRTPSPTPTDTPEPTDTPTPTNTPAPTNTPRPTSPPVPTNTPTPEPQPTVEYITVYYRSNPSEVLGVFPVRPFDANALYNNMLNMRGSLYAMRNALDGTQSGDPNACATYIANYENIKNNGVFYDDVPGDWAEIDAIYFISFIFSLDRTRPAYLSCVNSGQVDNFNYGLALQTIDQTLGILNPAIDAAATKL
ncbi:MAG: hypothetical protein L0332_21575, partial [Chloroflexi bacterium]|nr:hypothetical protein [Chloroflexota bacterium]